MKNLTALFISVLFLVPVSAHAQTETQKEQLIATLKQLVIILTQQLHILLAQQNPAPIVQSTLPTYNPNANYFTYSNAPAGTPVVPVTQSPVVGVQPTEPAAEVVPPPKVAYIAFSGTNVYITSDKRISNLRFYQGSWKKVSQTNAEQTCRLSNGDVECVSFEEEKFMRNPMISVTPDFLASDGVRYSVLIENRFDTFKASDGTLFLKAGVLSEDGGEYLSEQYELKYVGIGKDGSTLYDMRKSFSGNRP